MVDEQVQVADGRGQQGAKYQAALAALFGIALLVVTVTASLAAGAWASLELRTAFRPRDTLSTVAGVGLLVTLVVASAGAGLIGARFGPRFAKAAVISDVLLGVAAFVAFCGAAYVFRGFSASETIIAPCIRFVSPPVLYFCARIPSYLWPLLPPGSLLLRTAGAACAAAVLIGVVLAFIWTLP